MRLITTLALALFTQFIFAQESVDIQIVNLEIVGQRVNVDYVTIEGSQVETNMEFASINPADLSLSKNFPVYLIDARLGYIRTRLKDMLKRGPAAWENIPFTLHYKDGVPSKLEQKYVLID